MRLQVNIPLPQLDKGVLTVTEPCAWLLACASGDMTAAKDRTVSWAAAISIGAAPGKKAEAHGLYTTSITVVVVVAAPIRVSCWLSMFHTSGPQVIVVVTLNC